MTQPTLRTLIGDIEGALDRMTLADSVAAVRAATREAVASDAFLIDLSERALFGTTPVWCEPYLHIDATRSFGIRVFYWRPRQATGPHVHESWTVTGVVSNELEVLTYPYAPGDPIAAEVEPDRTYHARRGDVGFTLRHTLHNTVNRTGLPSIAVQTSDLDDEAKEVLARRVGRSEELVPGFRRLVQTAHAVALGSARDPRALELLERLAHDADPPIAALARRSARAVAQHFAAA